MEMRQKSASVIPVKLPALWIWSCSPTTPIDSALVVTLGQAENAVSCCYQGPVVKGTGIFSEQRGISWAKSSNLQCLTLVLQLLADGTAKPIPLPWIQQVINPMWSVLRRWNQPIFCGGKPRWKTKTPFKGVSQKSVSLQFFAVLNGKSTATLDPKGGWLQGNSPAKEINGSSSSFPTKNLWFPQPLTILGLFLGHNKQKILPLRIISSFI